MICGKYGLVAKLLIVVPSSDTQFEEYQN